VFGKLISLQTLTRACPRLIAPLACVAFMACGGARWPALPSSPTIPSPSISSISRSTPPHWRTDAGRPRRLGSRHRHQLRHSRRHAIPHRTGRPLAGFRRQGVPVRLWRHRIGLKYRLSWRTLRIGGRRSRSTPRSTCPLEMRSAVWAPVTPGFSFPYGCRSRSAIGRPMRRRILDQSL